MLVLGLIECRGIETYVLLTFSFLYWLLVLIPFIFISISCTPKKVSLDFIFFETSGISLEIKLALVIFDIVFLIDCKSSAGRNFKFEFAWPTIIGNLQFILEIVLVHGNQGPHHHGVGVLRLRFGQGGLTALLDLPEIMLCSCFLAPVLQVLETASAMDAFL